MQKCLIISISINMYFGTKNSIELVKKEREKKKGKEKPIDRTFVTRMGRINLFDLFLSEIRTIKEQKREYLRSRVWLGDITRTCSHAHIYAHVKR